MEQKTTLRELREQSGKTRAEVANALGVTPNAITNYEYGKRRLSLEQVLLLSKMYESTAEEIITAQLNNCLKAQGDNPTKH